MGADAAIEYVLKRDRWVVLAGLAGITALAWVYLAVFAAGMDGMTIAMAQVEPWTALDVALMVVMWAVMMVAMMVPSAAPMILLYALVARKSRGPDRPVASTSAFAAGYIVVWIGFSLAATAAQWALEQAALLSPMMVSTSPFLGGALLIGAGVYQWTPLKQVCLENCRSPIEFLSRSWRPGGLGALRMGIAHGAFCVGCCWVLMGLLFFCGVMNLLWIAAIAIFVLIEKLAPLGAHAGRVSGALLAAAGLAVMVRG